MHSLTVASLPNCDLCHGATARYDSKTTMGPHAYLCQDCYVRFGTEPTTELILRQPKKQNPNAPKTVHIKLTRRVVDDGIATVRCPSCKEPRNVEPDANYSVTCEACGFVYQVVSFF